MNIQMQNLVLIASDHAGLELKNQIVSQMNEFKWKDMGTHDSSSVDYPDYADLVASYIQKNPSEKAILICGSGQGMCMRANKYSNVRAALVYNTEIAKLSREHNDANILCLGARFLNFDEARKIIKIFFETEFAGGRHQLRVDKLKSPLK
jgi:ribose 5-phosphate isomerase B